MFSVEQSRLSPALDVVRAGLPSDLVGRRRARVLMDLKRGRLRLAAGSHGVHAEVMTPADGADVSALVSSELVDIVNYLDGPICFEPDESTLTLAAGGTRVRLACSAVCSHPELSMGPIALEGRVTAHDLRQSLKFLMPAIDAVGQKAESAGALFRWKNNILTVAAWNRYIRAVVRIPVDAEGTVENMLPSRIVPALVRLIESADTEEIVIVADEQAVRFRANNAVLVSRILDTSAVSWTVDVSIAAMRRAADTLTVPRTQLLAALQRVSLVAREARGVTLEYTSRYLRLSTVGNGQGAEELLPAESTGQGDFALEKSLLLAVLSCFDDQKVSVDVHFSTGRVLIRGTNPADFYLLSLLQS